MIDEIVEMILREARARAAKDPLRTIPDIIEDLVCKLFTILGVSISEERRIEEDENKG